MRILRSIVLLSAVLVAAGLIVVVVSFANENAAWVGLRVPWVALDRWPPSHSWVEYEGQLGLMLVGCFLAGGIAVVALVLVPARLRRAYDRRRQRRRISVLEDELTDLRNLPVTAPAPFEDLDDAVPDHAEEGEEDDAAEEAALISSLQRSATEQGR